MSGSGGGGVHRGTLRRPSRASVALGVAVHGAVAAYLYSMLWLATGVLIASTIGGLSPVLISGASMGPAIRPGDVLLLRDKERFGLEPGTVITFHDEVFGGRVLTHRIQSVNADGSYVTKGDANEGPDSASVAPADVLGYGRLVIPYIGLPAYWVRGGGWLPLLLWLAATAVACSAIAPRPRRPAAAPDGAAGDRDDDGGGPGAGPWPPPFLDPLTSRSAYSAAAVLVLLSPFIVSGAAFSATTAGSGSLTAADLLNPVAVAGGDAHVCGVDDGADVWCWGANGSGQLGDGTTTASSSPVQVVGAGGTGSLAGIAALDAGEQFTCAAGASGASWCWGLNTSGQLGDGTTTGSLTPVRAY